MAINLSKGSKINLKKVSPQTTKTFVVGLGWSPNDSASAHPIDLDASAFLVGANNKILTDEHFVFFNNDTSPDGSVIYGGDNRTGDGEDDDEKLFIDTSKINPAIQQIVFCCSIDEADKRGQNFSMVNDAYIRIYEQETGIVLATYYLADVAGNETGFILGRLLNNPDGWEFEAYPIGIPCGLEAMVEMYT